MNAVRFFFTKDSLYFHLKSTRFCATITLSKECESSSVVFRRAFVFLTKVFQNNYVVSCLSTLIYPKSEGTMFVESAMYLDN